MVLTGLFPIFFSFVFILIRFVATKKKNEKGKEKKEEKRKTKMKMKIDPRREIYVYLCIGPNKLSYISRLNSWHIRHVVDLRRAHI